MAASADTEASVDPKPPYWLRRLGLLSIPMVALCILSFCALARMLSGLILAIKIEISTLTHAVVWCGELLDDFWYVWFVGLALFYGGWVVKRFERILWFNAICIIVMPVVAVLPFPMYYRIQMILQASVR